MTSCFFGYKLAKMVKDILSADFEVNHWQQTEKIVRSTKADIFVQNTLPLYTNHPVRVDL